MSDSHVATTFIGLTGVYNNLFFGPRRY